MFRLEMFPAREGDALILSWGDDRAPRRMLIDAGRRGTAEALETYVRDNALGPGAFEVFLITHIDRDHIEGAVPLLRSDAFRPLVKQVWFNGRQDLDWHEPSGEFETMGALDGERISTAIRDSGMAWNTSTAPRPVAIVDGTLPAFELDGGLTLTVISPDLKQLAELADPWDDTLEEATEGWESLGPDEPIPLAQLAATPFRRDRAKPNGSSIALIAEYDGHRVLLGADAHTPRLLTSLKAYAAGDPDRRRMVLVKAPHHGSRGNTSADLVAAVDCPNWAFSTNGDQFRHPDAEAVARVVMGRAATRLFFNYRTPRTEYWLNDTQPARSIERHFGEDGHLTIDIEDLAARPL